MDSSIFFGGSIFAAVVAGALALFARANRRICHALLMGKTLAEGNDAIEGFFCDVGSFLCKKGWVGAFHKKSEHLPALVGVLIIALLATIRS